MENNTNIEKMPLYKKGKEIFEVVNLIAEIIPEDNRILNDIKAQMLNDALNLSVKVAGAEAADLYDIKMEAATIIRKSAMSLNIQNHSLKMYGFKEVEYFQMVKDLIEAYRVLFITWIEGFDKWNYVIDRWGLFNPPGVGPYDHDPDDDLPSQEY